MRVLIIEDDEVLAAALAERVRAQLPRAEVSLTHSRDDGLRAITDGVFDAAVIDLRIPSEHGADDATIENGLAIEAELAATQPGVLRLFLTASEAEVVVEQLRQGKVDDFFACGEEFCVVDYVRKDGVASLDACTSRLSAHNARLGALDAVDLEDADNLTPDARRALAITVRLAGGARGRVLRRDGLSGALTALVECADSSSNPAGNAFCKYGDAGSIHREREGYKLAEFVLPTTAFPKLARELSVGIGNSRALVFTQAPTGTTFFELAGNDPDGAAELVDKLPRLLKGWRDQATTRRTSVEMLLSEVLSENVATAYEIHLSRLHLDRLSGLELNLLHYCQHGDLHGANLFVATGYEPFLIDFAQTGPQTGPADHVSLELGLLFHPESPFYGQLGPEGCAAWLSDEATKHDGLGPILAACRRWAAQDGHDPLSYAAATLRYAIWILNHTDHVDQAVGIADAASRTMQA